MSPADNAAQQNKLLIIIPAKNEASSVAQIIEETKALGYADILLVNDNSSDNTAALAAKAGAIVLNLSISLGAWGAIQTGLRYAEQHQYPMVITMDADGQHEAASVPILRRILLKARSDVVIGAFPERGDLLRRVAWALFRFISGVTYADLTSGLRAYNHKAIKLLASEKATLLDYQDLGVLLLLENHGLLIEEVSINMQIRHDGCSRIFNSWWAVGRYMLHTFVLCLSRGNRLNIRRRGS